MFKDWLIKRPIQAYCHGNISDAIWVFWSQCVKHENENIGLARPEVEEIGPMKTGVYKTCQTMDDTCSRKQPCCHKNLFKLQIKWQNMLQKTMLLTNPYYLLYTTAFIRRVCEWPAVKVRFTSFCLSKCLCVSVCVCVLLFAMTLKLTLRTLFQYVSAMLPLCGLVQSHWHLLSKFPVWRQSHLF